MNQLTSSSLVAEHDFENADALEKQQLIFIGQLISLAILAVTAVVVWIVEKIDPDFFNFPYLQAASLETIGYFWPLFIYGALLALLAQFVNPKDSENDGAVLTLGIVTSVIAGIWEEFGFRCLFVCLAMLSLTFFNWLWGAGIAGLGAFIVGGIGVGILLQLPKSPAITAKIIVVAIGSGLLGAAAYIAYIFYQGLNVVFWFYEHLVVPIVNFVTFGAFESIFYGDYEPLLIFGMILANSWFRDGHKYQGWTGLLNSWVCGFILMYATLTYGLWTAIVLHILFNVQGHLVDYLAAKIVG